MGLKISTRFYNLIFLIPGKIVEINALIQNNTDLFFKAFNVLKSNKISFTGFCRMQDHCPFLVLQL
jgi:hypothetical protein